MNSELNYVLLCVIDLQISITSFKTAFKAVPFFDLVVSFPRNSTNLVGTNLLSLI